MSSLTKKVRVELNSAIRDGFRDRGWSAVRGAPGSYAAPETLVAPPLVLRLVVAIDADTYGGATLTADAVLQCDEVTEILVDFDRKSMPGSFSRFPGDALTRQLLDVGMTTVGGLVNTRGSYFAWEVKDLSQVQPVTGDFFAVIEGPLTDWISARATAAKVLDEFSTDPQSRLRTSSSAIRATTALALLQDRTNVAREAIAAYVPGLSDDEERVALFERELARRFPSYGLSQRS